MLWLQFDGSDYNYYYHNIVLKGWFANNQGIPKKT